MQVKENQEESDAGNLKKIGSSSSEFNPSGDAEATEKASMGTTEMSEPPHDKATGDSGVSPWIWIFAAAATIALVVVWRNRAAKPKVAVEEDAFRKFLAETSGNPLTQFYLEHSETASSCTTASNNEVSVAVLADMDVAFTPEDFDRWLGQLISVARTEYGPAVREKGVPFSEKTMVHVGPLEDPRDSHVEQILHRGLTSLGDGSSVLLPALVKASSITPNDLKDNFQG